MNSPSRRRVGEAAGPSQSAERENNEPVFYHFLAGCGSGKWRMSRRQAGGFSDLN
jgi:hypothetical protein